MNGSEAFKASLNFPMPRTSPTCENAMVSRALVIALAALIVCVTAYSISFRTKAKNWT